LLRSFFDCNQKPTEMNTKINDLILGTCKAIVSGGEEFRKNLIK